MKKIITIAVFALSIIAARAIEIPEGADFKLVSVTDGPIVTVEMTWTPKKKINKEKEIIKLDFSDSLVKSNPQGAVEFMKKALSKKFKVISCVDGDGLGMCDEMFVINKKAGGDSFYRNLRQPDATIVLSNGKRLDKLYEQWLISEYKRAHKK